MRNIVICKLYILSVPGSSSDIKEWLLMVTDHHDLMNHFLIELTRSVDLNKWHLISLSFVRILTTGSLNIRNKNEESKRKIKLLEKTHLKEYKTIKSNVRRKIESVNKIKKRKCKETFADRNDGLEEKMDELRIKCRLFENQEKQAVRRACLEERAIYCTVAAFVKQLMWKQSDILRSVNTKVDNSLDFITGRIESHHDIPDISLSSDQHYDFDTPATSVGGSLRGSRCGSFSSLGASRPSSPLCIVEQGDLGRGSSVRDTQRKRKSQLGSSYWPGQSASPSPAVLNEGIISSSCTTMAGLEGRREEARHVFSTIRRTRSPYRKQDLLARRPPLPKKTQTEAKMQAYFFPGSKQGQERTEGYAKMTPGSFPSPAQSGSCLVIVIFANHLTWLDTAQNKDCQPGSELK